VRAVGAWRRSAAVGPTLCRLARGLLALAPAVLPACYHYVPLRSAAEPGVQVQVELNDLGRVGLTDAVGPEAGKIDGVLESSSDSGMVVRVAQIEGEYGGVTRWEGERVAIRQEFIRTLRRREFSATRTAVVAAAAGAGIVVFVTTRNLLGIGGSSSNNNGNNGGNAQ
jgi:hypothetical protein